AEHAGMQARDRTHAGMLSNIRDANARAAMQNRISNNSMPR
ncbi:MAG: conjugal transfer protein TrbL, partial [Mesorhizobium sp.]